jgi:CheY-like chemotaxis protein
MAEARPSVRVLVVDDNHYLRDVMTRALRGAGYSVENAGNGREALEHLRTAPELPALILLDLRMPVMDGTQFRAAQRRDPSLAAIPVLVVSSEDDGPEAAAALEAAGYLLKPFHVDHLLEQVALHCSPLAGVAS